MTNAPVPANLLFQSDHHPLLPLEFESPESYILGLMHRKAYSRAAEMANGLDVLDVGCNNGYGTKMIAERSAQVIGVDVSARAIEFANATHAGPNIEYQVVDGTTLPFKEKIFDLVTSFQVIEHVDGVETYLREIHRVLRDTGKAVFTTPNRSLRLKPGQNPWNPFHVREYEAAELEETLRDVFPDVSIEGLFAVPELYKVECRRVARATSRRAHAARKFQVAARAAVIGSAKAVLPDEAIRRLRSVEAGRMASERAALAEFMARWSLSDLFYRDQDLDKALDLIAICSMSGLRPGASLDQ